MKKMVKTRIVSEVQYEEVPGYWKDLIGSRRVSKGSEMELEDEI